LKPDAWVRCCIFGAYLILVYHPGTYLQILTGPHTLAYSLPFFLAALLVFEAWYHRWSGAEKLNRAGNLYKKGALDPARSLLDKVIQANRHPGVASGACSLLATMEVEAGRFAEAMIHSRKARDLLEDRASKANHLALEGLINHYLGQPRESISRLKSARSMHPRAPLHGLVHLVRASLVLFHEQDARNGLLYLDKAAAASSHPFIRRQLPALRALALAEAGRLEEARTLLGRTQDTVALKPFVEGRILHLEEDFGPTIQAFQRALERLDDSFILYKTVARYHLGKAFYHLGRIQEGSTQLHQALQSTLPKPYRKQVPLQFLIHEDHEDQEEIHT